MKNSRRFGRIIARLFAFVFLFAGLSGSASEQTPASFGVEISPFTHLGFGNDDEMLEIFTQATPLPRLAGVQMTYGASGVWAYKTTVRNMTLFGLTGTKSVGSGRVLFSGLSVIDPNKKRDFDVEIGRAAFQAVHQLSVKLIDPAKGIESNLRIISIVASIGYVETTTKFPEEATTVFGKAPEAGLGIQFEADYLAGQILRCSAILVYRDMDFSDNDDELFTNAAANVNPLELQLRGGVELLLAERVDINIDMLATVSESKNFIRFGIEVGLRYLY